MSGVPHVPEHGDVEHPQQVVVVPHSRLGSVHDQFLHSGLFSTMDLKVGFNNILIAKNP